MIERKIYIQIAVLFVGFVFLMKLLDIQLIDSQYKGKADKNMLSRVVEYPLRGMIYDRHGQLIVNNKPTFDLYFIPKQLFIKDTAEFCEFFSIEKSYLHEQLAKAKRKYKSYPFIKHLSMQDFAKIQDRLSDIPGITVVARTVREYPSNSMANILGYVKEVDKSDLKKDTTNYYRQGDLIGKSGIERYYENYLRGKQGVKYVMTNVRGMVKGSYKNGKLDTLPVVGEDLISSIDLDLQQYGEKLMQHKKGAIVAIEPSTGEILTMISAPSYDPNLLTGKGKQVSKNYVKLLNNPNKPLYNRAIQSPYPPGSTYKTVMALVGLQDKALDTVHTYFSCDKSIVGCHGHPSPLNVHGSIQHSCNPWYVKALRQVVNQGRRSDPREDTRVGLDSLHDKLLKFGLGRRLGLDLPYEHSGRVPSTKYYDENYYTKNWKLGNIYSISIGQGEVGVVPLQMANLAATIANRGWYITPHMIKGIGDSLYLPEEYTAKNDTGVDAPYFDYVARAMADVVKAGTARRAFIEDIVVCGKTGTAQNPHGEDHSVFMAFAPLYNPKIAIAVYVENAGFGGTWAAPIASLMIEKYIKREIQSNQRKWLEQYVLSGKFIEEEEKESEE
ncbi:penicillin-binding protein 2 [Rapidithrix thailandica]|uniref:Penicillin-binding protein 2 n=1 Tax=Rapidithrix thailandica TaxID=413964 RepID=A0AAW9S9Y7_9BACT